MKTLFYITGKQGSGKSVLSTALRNASTIDMDSGILTEKKIIKELEFKEAVVITSNFRNNPAVCRNFRKFAKENNLYFFNIKLK